MKNGTKYGLYLTTSERFLEQEEGAPAVTFSSKAEAERVAAGMTEMNPEEPIEARELRASSPLPVIDPPFRSEQAEPNEELDLALLEAEQRADEEEEIEREEKEDGPLPDGLVQTSSTRLALRPTKEEFEAALDASRPLTKKERRALAPHEIEHKRDAKGRILPATKRAPKSEPKAKKPTKVAAPPAAAAPTKKAKGEGARTLEERPLVAARKAREAGLNAEGDSLAKLCEGWLAHIEDEGTAAASVGSYRIDLAIAQDVLGASTQPKLLGPKRIAEFWNHKRVTTKRDGTPKSVITTTKIRRAFRLAFTWAIDAGKYGLDDSKDAARLFARLAENQVMPPAPVASAAGKKGGGA